jgi:MFS family permease
MFFLQREPLYQKQKISSIIIFLVKLYKNTRGEMTTTVIPLWKRPNFLKLWFSQSLNSLAQILLQVIMMIEIYIRMESAIGPALVLAIMSISSFVSSFIASYHIDRFPLKKIVHYAGWIKGVIALAIGYFLFLGTTSALVGVFVSLVILSFVGAWYGPARFALLPLVIERKEYIKANRTLVMVDQLLATAGWGLGALLALYIPFPILISMIACSFMLAGLLIYFLKLEEEQATIKKKTKESPAWKEVWNNRIIRGITIMDTVEGVANAIWTSALILTFTSVVLQVGEEWWGFINAGYFVGAILGSMIVTFKAQNLSSKIGMMIGLSGISMGVLTILFSFNTIPLIAVLLCVLMGPMYQARDICQSALLQDAIPEGRRAGIMAARNSFLSPWSGMMVLVVGILADFFGVQFIYFMAGIAYLLVSLLAFKLKYLREYKLADENAM